MKGKPWTAEEEKHLKELIEQRKPINIIAATMNKSRQAIKLKMNRLDLKEVGCGIHDPSSSRLNLPDDLPSVEEALHLLCKALDELNQKGLDQNETLRLRSIIQGVKIYKELFADYVNYRGIEAKLIEMEEKYERLAAQAKSNTPKPDEQPNT